MDEREDAGRAARAARGVVDVESGLESAQSALLQLRHTAFEEMRVGPEVLTSRRMALQGVLSRAEAFHVAAMQAIRDGNPFAAFTLIRSYAENAALMVWLQEKPGRIDLIDPAHPNVRNVRVGALINAAAKRLGGFKPVYEQLSAFAHPAGSMLFHSWSPDAENDAHVEWRSAPRFKRSEDAEIACFWLIELAEANTHLWAECYRAFLPDAASSGHDLLEMTRANAEPDEPPVSTGTD